MDFPRFPDWLIYSAVAGAIVFGAMARREHADSAEPPPPPPGAEDVPLGPDSPFDPINVIRTSAYPNTARGTAFAAGEGGLWLTARSTLAGCKRVALKVAEGRAVIARQEPSKDPNLAVLWTQGGPTPLAIGPDGAQGGERGFVIGFPRGGPGEVAGLLMARDAWSPHGRQAVSEPALVWSESGRTRGMDGGLPGAVGAPVLDDQGRVAGVVLAQSARRGRFYTTLPGAVGQVVSDAGAEQGRAPLAETLTVETYGRVADDLRRQRRIVQVLCLSD